MASLDSLKQAIGQERLQREAFSGQDLVPMIRGGAGQEALENLVFFTAPLGFSSHAETLEQHIASEFRTAGGEAQERYLGFVAELALALGSFLPAWNLKDTARHGDAALGDDQVDAAVGRMRALVRKLADQAPAVAETLLTRWRGRAAVRFEAENASDPLAQADALVGVSIDEYLANMRAELAHSNVRRIAEMRDAGQTLTEISNDYAAFLQYALYLGASFATTNPPLVDYAWLADPERWTPIVDHIIADHPQAEDDELARRVTLEVVLANMRLLRPIFLLSGGEMGCVCLQVNPHNHADAGVMITDALAFYDGLRTRLQGGVPNVVFKLPGTKGGLEACRALTKRGIGVTITVDFGMFQHIPFAEAMNEGHAIFSCLVEMNGRLAYPVRDELLAGLEELAAYGIDEARAREAAAWAGVAVTKRLYAWLTEHGYDLRRFKPLVASLRIYKGDGYERLPSAYPDITEILGASILSVFPNVRRPFDQVPALAWEPMRIEAPVPDEVLEVLSHSEIFRQAYYVADRAWLPEQDGFKPDDELTLDDEAAVAAWAPIRNTLGGFQQSFDTFVARILDRKRVLSV